MEPIVLRSHAPFFLAKQCEWEASNVRLSQRRAGHRAASRTRLERRAAADHDRAVAIAAAHEDFHPSTETPEAYRARAKAVATADAAYYFAELERIEADYHREVAQHETAQRAVLWGAGQ